MSKVLTFSTTFPSYHRKRKEPTHFVEQILNCMGIDYRVTEYCEQLMTLNKEKIDEGKLTEEQVCRFFSKLNKTIETQKPHTIRAGNRFEVYELFSPRVWSGKPYQEPQIIFAPDTRIKKEWKFELTDSEYLLKGEKLNLDDLTIVAANDGFTDVDDFELWFQKPFKGYVICWDEKIQY